MHNLYGMIRPTDKTGAPTGEEVFNFHPRAFIVVGSLNEFVTEHGVNIDQLRSFELYRNSIAGIDILTYDELYERSKFVVDPPLQIIPLSQPAKRLVTLAELCNPATIHLSCSLVFTHLPSDYPSFF
jgi:hypothetical protein